MPKKLKKLERADGRNSSDIRKIHELEELLGTKPKNPFGIESQAEFDQLLADSNLCDLQNLCQKCNLFASGNREDLKARLASHFDFVSRGTKTVTVSHGPIKYDPSNPDHVKLKELWELK